MYTKQKPFFLIAQTPVHVGSGSDLGVIDLPIQREGHTGFPKIEASGIKGVFREYFQSVAMPQDPKMIDLLFGPEQGDAHSSATGFIDARILFFPVKSVKGIFAWITCIDVLAKFQEAILSAGFKIEDEKGNIDLTGLCANIITGNSAVCITRQNTHSVVLEEYPVTVTPNSLLSRFADWVSAAVFYDPGLNYQSQKLKTSLVVVSPEMFTRFAKHSTEVVARNRIDSDKATVVKGALWYEEYLPVETVLYSMLLSSQPMMMHDDMKKAGLKDEMISKLDKNADEVMKQITDRFPQVIQIGGKTTIGKGFMKPCLLKTNGLKKKEN